ncbi:hypothetical protein S83_070829 [Arachis hypogaea]
MPHSSPHRRTRRFMARCSSPLVCVPRLCSAALSYALPIYFCFTSARGFDRHSGCLSCLSSFSVLPEFPSPK